MRKIAVFCSLALVAAVTSQASAQYQWYENFENGTNGWNVWTQRGTSQATIGTEAESPVLGNEPGWSGANAKVAHVGGSGYNGGIWKVVTLPLGPGTYRIDGYWRTHQASTNNQWGEVIVMEGAVNLLNSSDYTAPLKYKNDTFGGRTGWNGKISATSPVTNVPNFTTASGTVTILLKSGNGSGTTSVDFDDISITPEPATAALLALAGLPLLRRRRRQA